MPRRPSSDCEQFLVGTAYHFEGRRHRAHRFGRFRFEPRPARSIAMDARCRFFCSRRPYPAVCVSSGAAGPRDFRDRHYAAADWPRNRARTDRQPKYPSHSLRDGFDRRRRSACRGRNRNWNCAPFRFGLGACAPAAALRIEDPARRRRIIHKLCRRPDRTWREIAAAVRANAFGPIVHAIAAERALEGADHGVGRRRRQILVAAFELGRNSSIIIS